jgi:hypothetical protein
LQQQEQHHNYTANKWQYHQHHTTPFNSIDDAASDTRCSDDEYEVLILKIDNFMYSSIALLKHCTNPTDYWTTHLILFFSVQICVFSLYVQ